MHLHEKPYISAQSYFPHLYHLFHFTLVCSQAGELHHRLQFWFNINLCTLVIL